MARPVHCHGDMAVIRVVPLGTLPHMCTRSHSIPRLPREFEFHLWTLRCIEHDEKEATTRASLASPAVTSDLVSARELHGRYGSTFDPNKPLRECVCHQSSVERYAS
eukprot:5162329-Amphidinium_carterae.2